MSQHFYKKREPPVGVTSFTKIRLGWVSQEQVLLVQPGQTACAFLSPLAKKGDTLAVKVPLSQGHYYLIENRQPIGFDRILPDSGILILKVDPHAQDGMGPVKVMDADPDSENFSHATFRLDQQNRNLFIDKRRKVAIIPLWAEQGNQGVLLTTPNKSAEALEAAEMIRKLKLRMGDQKQLVIQEAVSAFKKFEFRRSAQIAENALELLQPQD